jgi:hypothetical protein
MDPDLLETNHTNPVIIIDGENDNEKTYQNPDQNPDQNQTLNNEEITIQSVNIVNPLDPENNVIKNIINEFSNKLKIQIESDQNISIENILNELQNKLKEELKLETVFNTDHERISQIYTKIIYTFIKENEELIDSYILKDKENIIDINLEEIDNYPTSHDINDLRKIAEQHKNEDVNQETTENDKPDKPDQQDPQDQQIETDKTDINNVDRLYALLFGFEKLLNMDEIDIKTMVCYMIRFNNIKTETIKNIIENSSSPENDIEDTGLGRIDISNMLNALKHKLNEDKFNIILKNIKYYTIKFKYL